MPRIIMHTPEPASAAARYVRELLNGLTLLGLKMDLVCPENFQFRAEIEKNPLITVHWTPRRSISTQRGWLGRVGTNLSFLFSAWSGLLCTAQRGDIVHFQFVLRFPFGALFFLAAKLKHSKIVFTVHDPLPHKWLFPHSLRWLEQGTLKWAYRVSDCLIVHSEPGKLVLTDQFGQDANKITIIAHGPFVLGCGDIPMQPSRVVELLVFGSIRENKGVHLAIGAIQKLHRDGVPVHLTIAGDVLNSAEQGYWDECLKLISSYPTPIRIIRKFIPEEELPDLFAGCHAVLLPYAQFFSDSGVALMALANARPIIATRAGGLGPLMDGAKLAVTIYEASVEGVEKAVLEAVSLGLEELIRRGQSGSAYVNKTFGWLTLASTTRSVYAQCQTVSSAVAKQKQTTPEKAGKAR